MDIENIYHNLRKLNAENFEMMSSFIAKYFYRENKSYFQDDYGCYTIHDMLKKLSDKSADEICFQIHKCQDIERFNSMVDFVENAIKDKNSDEQIKENNEYSNMIIDENGHRYLPQYYEFGVAKYALSDCIEALTNNDAKEIIVTKVDGDLMVRYKPYWRG